MKWPEQRWPRRQWRAEEEEEEEVMEEEEEEEEKEREAGKDTGVRIGKSGVADGEGIRVEGRLRRCRRQSTRK